MDITKAVFKRQFAMSMYKNRKLPLGEMTFTKDFVTETKRGDLYPVISRTESCPEQPLYGGTGQRGAYAGSVFSVCHL